MFYPIVNAGWIDCPNTPDEDLTDAQVRDFVASLLAGPWDLESTLNDVPIVSLQVPIVRAQSPEFSSVLPNNNVQAGVCVPSLAAGRTGCRIADGHWVMLPPLPPGLNKLKFRGTSPGFEVDVTYVITVPGRH